MQIGLIGLGRMGANMVRRLQRAGHRCVVFDRNADAAQSLGQEGAKPAASVAELIGKLEAPRTEGRSGEPGSAELGSRIEGCPAPGTS